MHHCLFFLFIFLFTLKMSQSLLEDILHKVTLTKIISDSTQASGWARLSFPFFFHLDFFCIRTSYHCKLGQEGKISRFSFLLWIGQSYQGKAQRSAWLRSSQVQRSQSRWGPPALPSCSLPRRRSGRCRRPQKRAAGERVEWGVRCSWNTEQGPGGWGEEQRWDERGACGSETAAGKEGLAGPARKVRLSTWALPPASRPQQ